ncbi:MULTISPECIES: glycine oxidase ThiO [Bacillus]|uniref:glycine oxidase ThiO n=1 Tax=Bacillus TaxID=1386 RepID=UPI00101DDFF8|nr:MULTISPECIES: glycine oxidase ThiO [Bacillus]MCA1035533.1 glycine oxidase ThiO [Bacillus infantis]RYI26899.1 glycine oxidase ThiO [Bacillus infantis]
MKKVYDVIIAGGGIIGCSIAYQQAKLGKQVLILEKRELCSEASSAAAGMLGAQAEIDENLSMLKLALKSRAMFPDIIQELEDLTGISIGLVNEGMIKIAWDDTEAEVLQKQVRFHEEWDGQVRWMDQGEICEREPHLSRGLAGGMLIPNDGQLIAPNLARAFAVGAMARGAVVLEGTEIEDFIFDKESVEGVMTSKGSFYGETVIAAAGAWTGKLLKKADLELPIFPVKGECLSVIPEGPLIRSTIFSDSGGYLVPKKDGRLIIGATSYENEFNPSVSFGGVRMLAERAYKLLPQLASARWEKAWAGIRPQTGDGLPYIGWHPAYKGLFIAAGHYRNGILLSPITGKMVSDSIEGTAAAEDKELYREFEIERGLKKVQEGWIR